MRDVKIPNWLKGLPLAPEFHPTDTEFADPIAYISKIEKQASAFGICKVIPPLPKPSKKYVLSNLNKSLSKCPELGSEVNLADGEGRAVFTTRHQELGQNAKRTKGGSVQTQLSAAVHKHVWQSGEIYTVEQFESKSKIFARSQLGMIKEVSPLVIEALFWKAASEKPISVEYANDVPGSGFGEPEGSFRYFRRGRKRRKTFNKGPTIHSSSNPNDSVMMSLSDQTSRQKSPNAVDEMEGSAGWKLSNSPWNLQAIARSAGSLTRFMPDDIPGVTSPMVYIGMLFSWFAWHVEDHELHSLNFLHTGSSKTWYAVPEDYAFDFEEVIRQHAYGGNIDRLAALTLLGEKTTLLSPEAIVASGIPCCRLIQNPGEFVVTFPRAYHVGFSHGFSCGEAANFGTPKWLKVAKEAAVRRAAMNYLPMLSHQQLLYLLTMSFISRVPRSLLPGARSSRLRDRQKEERELLVKKAFIEDIINENNLLTNILRKNSSYHVVLWDLELLPSPSKERELCSSVATLATTPKEDTCSEKNSNEDLYSQMSICMETVNDLYLDDDDDDLSSDFQVDSGTLACVACGILGFPFMSVVQPSEKASMNLREQGVSNPVEPQMVDDSVSDELRNEQHKTLENKMPSASESIIPATRSPKKSGNELELTNESENSSIASSSFSLGATDKIMIPKESNLTNLSYVVSSTSVESSQSMPSPVLEPSLPPKDLPEVDLGVKFEKRWNTSSELLRPRIFCLEHAIQIEELLRFKGGANMLLICHSDFQKIKAHASAVAEEIGSPFKYNDTPLETASQEDLNLINLSIDDEHNQCGEDWTSKLGINLRQCVKVRKDSSSVQVKHALKVSGLFLDSITTPSPSALNLNWHSRKFRSKLNFKHRVALKPSAESIQTKKDEVKTDDSMVRQEDKIIQYYSRRTFKSKPGGGSAGARITKDRIENSDPLHVVETVNTEIENNTMQEMIINGKACDSIIQSNSELQNKIGIAEEDDEKNERCNGEESACSPVAIKSTETVEMCVERKSMEEVSTLNEALDPVTVDNCGGGSSVGADGHDDLMKDTMNEACDLLTVENYEGGSSVGVDGHDLMKDVSYSACSSNDYPIVTSSAERVERIVVEKSNTNSEVLHSETLGDRMNEKELISTNVTSSEQSIPGLVEESFEVSQETTRATEKMQSGCRRKRELELQTEDNGFIRSPCEGLRSRAGKKNATTKSGIDPEKFVEEKEPPAKKKKKPSDNKLVSRTGDKRDSSTKKRNVNNPHRCDLEGCRMSFQTKAELSLHKRNKCPHEGCGKKFSTHKYAILHQRVHGDDRPLKCPWKGCTMSFKWAWARTEHLRVHTGERPYQCKVEGCGLTFRFVSDFSRHRRKTGHYVNLPT